MFSPRESPADPVRPVFWRQCAERNCSSPSMHRATPACVVAGSWRSTRRQPASPGRLRQRSRPSPRRFDPGKHSGPQPATARSTSSKRPAPARLADWRGPGPAASRAFGSPRPRGPEIVLAQRRLPRARGILPGLAPRARSVRLRNPPAGDVPARLTASQTSPVPRAVEHPPRKSPD